MHSGRKRKAVAGAARKHPSSKDPDTHVALLISAVPPWSTRSRPLFLSLSPSFPPSFSLFFFFTPWNLVPKCIISRAKFGDTTPAGNLHTFTLVHPDGQSRVSLKREENVSLDVEGNFHTTRAVVERLYIF